MCRQSKLLGRPSVKHKFRFRHETLGAAPKSTGRRGPRARGPGTRRGEAQLALGGGVGVRRVPCSDVRLGEHHPAPHVHSFVSLQNPTPAANFRAAAVCGRPSYPVVGGLLISTSIKEVLLSILIGRLIRMSFIDSIIENGGNVMYCTIETARNTCVLISTHCRVA